jgi:hypothetical protein
MSSFRGAILLQVPSLHPLRGTQKPVQISDDTPCELTARAAAMDSIERHGNVQVLGVYQCPHCGGWHLTRQVGDYAVTSADPIVPVLRNKR